MTLDAAERSDLLRLARAAIVERLGDPGALARVYESIERTPHLEEHRAAFVTLRVAGKDGPVLRGCIGTLLPERALHEEVSRNAAAAAFDDPRFPPLRREELPEVRLSISVLTPMRPIDHPHEITVGRHGVVFALGSRRSVFLPEVAVEQGWDRETLLRHLARKAGLAPEAWIEASFRIFETEAFQEIP